MIIWGFRTTTLQLVMLTLLCRGCGNPAAHSLNRRVTKFTLFFIPLFPVSKKHHLQCTFCGLAYEIDRANADQLLAQAQGQPQPGYPQAQPGHPQGQPGYPQGQQPYGAPQHQGPQHQAVQPGGLPPAQPGSGQWNPNQR
ncbi:zinc ribbon domain-containing protein [Goodfellowiella coeruleoviolacea]|uniref:Zinc-ribbon 15 domain-containing protein n=1 Tax=Goodfellowiella coeruleoviolacea TaxID=334858 RepID=A0AAE3KK14_9PSEU|nr:zinc-ribbon domain-containing protein [Goodfellowiella coeruleoviolacea]MCP2164948.1 hypothetical protein [Goodfellowiella coeruleoviolacea]